MKFQTNHCHIFDENIFEFKTNYRRILDDKVVEFQTTMFVIKPMQHKVENSTTLQDDQKNLERTVLFIIAIQYNRTLRRMSSDSFFKFCAQMLL